MVWYTQIELVLVISVLARKFRYLNNKIDMAIFQEGEEGELKSENIRTKNSPLLREALGPLAWAFSENKTDAVSFPFGHPRRFSTYFFPEFQMLPLPIA